MGRRRKGEAVSGWINLDKPYDLTSTHAVSRVRRIFNAQKAGHAGTLDPLATGILPIALGEATKTIPFAQDARKTYSFIVRWGEERTTDDAEGEISATSDVRPNEAAIRAILPRFTGLITQVPPKFSAIKVGGERAYDLARAGEEVVLESREAMINSLELLEVLPDSARFICDCGKGTYMRSLARDMARALGSVGHIADLRREAVGPFNCQNAISLAKLEENLHSALLPVETVLDDIPALALNEREAARLKNGQTLSFIARPDMERLLRAGLDLEGTVTALAIYEGKPIALVDVSGPDIRPVRVLNL
jgi:tRNA pseudouridine55 synthase